MGEHGGTPQGANILLLGLLSRLRPSQPFLNAPRYLLLINVILFNHTYSYEDKNIK